MKKTNPSKAQLRRDNARLHRATSLPNTQGLVTPGTGHSAENAPASRRHQ